MRIPLRIAAIAALSLTLTGQIPANASGNTASPGKDAQRHQVTLITGDVVTFFAGEEKSFIVDVADGRNVTFSGRTGSTIATTRDFYVIPSDVAGDKRLDPELFNVTGLVREGLDRATSLPVLVKGARGQRTLRGGSGLAPMKAERKFLSGLAKDAKVWLNHRRKVSLDWSVPQIGAPAAWAAGLDGTGVTVAVIDTGIDKTHPDLADRVIAEQNFAVDDPDAGDYYGHGTHVASTIAGSGAASDGQYKGVAPGAKLINAKACSGEGYCYDDWLMAAMDYAAHSGAKIVNMSVGGGVSDGTDPLSLEVNRLTEETGVLFVVAAGNAGEYGAVTVGSPGAAQSALTVGAVDRNDKLAYFSSRGPRYLDAGVKPDLTAPGVGIVAARAVDTGMGEPVGDFYTAASGTSMATPHVAGAAAILAQQHRKWQAGRLKDALVSTAKNLDGRVTEMGAGRVDVARAYAAKVTGSSSVDFGRLARRTVQVKKIVYRNDGSRPMLLNLRLTGTGWNGTPLPRLGAVVTPLVWVPAHGQAEASLIVSTYAGDIGAYSGVVTATGGGVELRTPMSYYIVPETFPLTVKVLGGNGQQIQPRLGVDILRDDFDPVRNNDPFAQLMFEGEYHENGDVVADVPIGTYTALHRMFDQSLTSRARWAALSKVDVPVRNATTITLDARKVVPITANAGAAEARVHSISLSRDVRGGASVMAGCSCVNADAFATPTPAPRFGGLTLQDTWTFAERTTSVWAGGRDLHPIHDPYELASKLPGQRALPVVSDPDADVNGKVALVALTVPPNSEDPQWDVYLAGYEAAKKAKAAGALAIVGYVDLPGALAQPNLRNEIPFLALSQAEGLALRDAGTIELSNRAAPSFVYNLHYGAPNGIPASLTQVVDPAKLTRVDSEYHADLPGFRMMRAWVGFRKGASGSMLNPAVYLPARTTVAEYVGGSPDALENVTWTRIGVIDDGKRNQITMYNRSPFTAKDVWFAGPSSPGGFDPHNRAFYRMSSPGGAQLMAMSSYMGDGSQGHLLDVSYNGYKATKYRLYMDGAEIPGIYTNYSYFPYFEVPDERASYRLDAVTVLPASGIGGPTLGSRRLSPRVDTSWTFSSDRGLPAPCYAGSPLECKDESLLQPFYDLGLDLSNNAKPGSHSFGVQVQRTNTGLPVTLSALEVSYSVDEGATWRLASVDQGRVTVDNPASGFVWLRVSASTSDGSSVTQTVQRAYGVS